MKIVPDTSILIDGKMTELAEEGEIEGKVIIPEFVVDESKTRQTKAWKLVTQVSKNQKLRELGEQKGFEVSFKGRKPTEEEIGLAKSGRIDALIRDLAEEIDGKLYTGDIVQAKIAEAKGIDYFLLEKNGLKLSRLKNISMMRL